MKNRFAHARWIVAGAITLIVLSYVATCLHVRTMAV